MTNRPCLLGFLAALLVVSLSQGQSVITYGFGGATPWDPSMLSPAPLVWISAADDSTITHTGTDVTTWGDKSGNSNDFTDAGVVAAQYTDANDYVECVNSQLELTYDHNNTNYVHAFLMADILSSSATGGRFITGAIAAPDWWSPNAGLLWGNTSPNVRMRASNDDNKASDAVTAWATTEIDMIEAVVENLAPEMWVDAVEDSDTDTNLSAAVDNQYVVLCGGDIDDGNMRIYEFLYFVRDVNANETACIQGYLAWTWGEEADLPTGHAYEDAAPTTADSRS